MSKLLTVPGKAFQAIRKGGGGAFMRRLGEFLEREAHGLSMSCQSIQYQRVRQLEWPADRPLVSVIIPCYNYGRFLREAIESALAQTFQRFEILVVNDGSTDELTRQVLQQLSYPRTRVIHQQNQGLAQTRNNGAAVAAGKYICYLDADDAIEPTYLEKTLGLLESDESLGSCFSWVRCFGDHDSIWETADLDPFFLRKYDTAPAHSVIRKAAWEEVKRQNGRGFLTEYNGYCEDWIFWIDMVQCGYRGQVIKEPLIRYRVHKGSLLATHKAGYAKMLGVLHDDRRRFFHDRRYARDLQRKLNRRIYVENNLINLSAPEFYNNNHMLEGAAAGGTHNLQAAETYGSQ